MRQAHRLIFEAVRGPIPESLDVDHLCHNRACVNPNHLRAASRRVNAMNRAGLNPNNVSGVRGVHWESSRSKWRVKVAGRILGRFDTIEEAAAVADEARRGVA